MQIMQGSFRLIATSSPGYGSLVWPDSTDIEDHQANNHLQFPAFWLKEQVFQ